MKPSKQKQDSLTPARGQALIEFAVIGSLALLALAFLMQIGLQMNYRQEIAQQTFRLAMQTAQSEDELESQAINYQQIRNRQVPDPRHGFAILPRAMTDAGATVTWGEWLTFLADDRDSQPRIVANLDGQIKEYRSEDLIPDTPLIGAIDKTLSSTGAIHQDNEGSRLSTTTTEDTTVTFNVTQDPTLTSSLTAGCDFQGADWECSGAP
jgi:hypothetical protein